MWHPSQYPEFQTNQSHSVQWGPLSPVFFFLIPAFTQTSLPDVCKEPVSLLIKTVFYDESVITELYLCKTLIIQISFVYVSAKH